MNVATVLYFSIFYLFTSNFQLEEIHYVQFNEIVLQSNQIAKNRGVKKNFFKRIYLVGTNSEKNPNHMFLNQNLIKIRFLESQLYNFPFLTLLRGESKTPIFNPRETS